MRIKAAVKHKIIIIIVIIILTCRLQPLGSLRSLNSKWHVTRFIINSLWIYHWPLRVVKNPCLIDFIITNVSKRVKNVWLICFSGRIPGLSLIQHSLYVWAIEKPPLPPLTGEQYGKILSRNILRVVTARVFYILTPSFNFLIIQWRRQPHLTWSSPHDVVSREINPWKSVDLFWDQNCYPWHQVPGA